ncbi:MAG: glutaredoxin [Candidatus Aminicenantes bacterium]|nr:glutaredoxin [Candidatus Aminicenantes bacterium]
MALLNDEVREATRKKFAAEMARPVRLVHFTQEPSRLIVLNPLAGQDCFFCKETKQLLEEVAACSDKIELVVYDFKADKAQADEYGIDKIPATIIAGEKDSGIRIFGIPSGYEYTSLIEAVIDVSKGETSLGSKTKEALKRIDRPVHIQVFVTPTCPHCSLAVRLAHQFALESPLVKADMVESTEFPHLANKFGVYGVPKTVVNDTTSFEGSVPEDVFLANVLKALAPTPTA